MRIEPRKNTEKHGRFFIFRAFRVFLWLGLKEYGNIFCELP